MNYDKVNLFLGEDNSQQIKSLEMQRLTIKKRIEQLDNEKKKLIDQYAELGKKIATLGGSVIEISEDTDFEMAMLLSEKDKAKESYKKLHPKGKLSFIKFDKNGVDMGTANIETSEYKIYFQKLGISYYKNDVFYGSISYDKLYSMKDKNKWDYIFDYKYSVRNHNKA
jgi:hypothetical protein